MTNKKYETPQVNVVEMQTAPLLTGSGERSFSGENASWNGLSEDGE